MSAAAGELALDDPALAADARRHVHEVVSRSGSSFTWGMRMLPAARREAMYAIYAFCREVDDVADEGGTRDEKLAQLAAWRHEIEELFAGRPSRPTTRALLGPVRDFALPKAEFLALIDGMEMDAREAMVAPSQEELTLYCRRVAGAVGMLSIQAFGAPEPAARELAVALGEGLQLTNILRDLDEDAAEGRLYLPREALEAAGIGSRVPAEVLADPALEQVCRGLAETAEARFRQSRALLRQCHRRALRPSILMMEVYRRILVRLRARGWRAPRRPVRLGGAEKLWVVLRHGLL